ncbi:MAG: helix-turn-helix transcriptional regulator [Bacteroidota bacterium]
MILPVYHIDDFDGLHSRADWYCSDLATHLVSHRFVNSPHKHDFFVNVLFTQGSGTHTIDFNTYPVAPGYLFTMQPGQMHNWSLSPDCDGWVFFHSAAFFTEYNKVSLRDFPMFASFRSYPLTVLNGESAITCGNWFRDIFAQVSGNERWQKPRVAALATLLYADISVHHREDQQQPGNGYASYLEHFARELEQHFRTEKSVNAYASKLKLSEKHLNRVVRSSLGRSVSELISERVVLEARRLLVHSGMNVSEIAIELGFADVSYFVRFFRKHSGVTPLEFRGRHLGA